MNSPHYIYINKPYPEIRTILLPEVNVTDIRILHISPGAGIVNRFGHLLFHLVLKDEQDVVISYRGHVCDFKMSLLKGLFGLYKIRPFCFTLDRARHEYISNLQRTMASYQLNLTKKKKQTLLNKLIHDYWNYSKGYSFLYRNCAKGVAQAINEVFKYSHKPLFKELHPQLYMEYLMRLNIVNEKSPIHFENIQNSSNQTDKSICKKFESEKMISTHILKLFHHKKIFLNNHTKKEIVEIISNQFELNREALSTGASPSLEATKELRVKILSHLKAGPYPCSANNLGFLRE